MADKTKIECPECGGALYWWTELLSEIKETYMKNGKFEISESKPKPFPCGDMQGIGCHSCGKIFNVINEKLPKKWDKIANLMEKELKKSRLHKRLRGS